MKLKQKISWFLSGILVSAIAVSITSPALAALTGKTIQVFTGINLYLDDASFYPTDPNGNSVEAFVLDGTTYLPVRAISEALGVPIQWEGSTQSVYIGKHSSDTPAAWLSQMPNFSGTDDRNFKTAATEKDNTGATHTYCITESFDRTYLLNGQYSRMTGTLYQTWEGRSRTINYNDMGVTIYGDGNLLYSYSPEKGIEGMKPQSFDVDLTGILELRVEFDGSGFGTIFHSDYILSLGDVGLYT